MGNVGGYNIWIFLRIPFLRLSQPVAFEFERFDMSFFVLDIVIGGILNVFLTLGVVGNNIPRTQICQLG